MIEITAAAVIAYLAGSINSSIIIGRIYGRDIREYGSGNAGLTNTMRVLGKKAALFVLVIDVLKGIAACLIAYALIGSNEKIDPYLIGGAFAIIGHNWPVYFKFKGGKGALTAVAVAFMIDPTTAGVLLAVFIIILILFKTVSLATITTGIIYPFATWFFVTDKYTLIYSIVISVIIIYRHRSNIKRLIKGEESKIVKGDR